MRFRGILFIASIVMPVFTLTCCYRPFAATTLPVLNAPMPSAANPIDNPNHAGLPTLNPSAGEHTPTPDAPHSIPTPRMDSTTYTVQPGDTLHVIAEKFLIDLNLLISANPGIDPNWLAVGQMLQIPPAANVGTAPAFKVIPDSELIFSPYTSFFDIGQFVKERHGFLSSYAEDVEGKWMAGFEIIDRVAREYSVNPRILLALLEHQSQWVTQTNIPERLITYPMRFFDIYKDGLYKQLAWAASSLNAGFYAWQESRVSFWFLADGAAILVEPRVNSGTAAVQYTLGLLYGSDEWNRAVNEQGLFATYSSLFGSPFAYSFDPLIPSPLIQPALQLPFEQGAIWSFTGGPHPGWGEGSAWAALDFAPPGEPMGCQASPAWVTAVADGRILRSENGVVILDLDHDGFEQTGWTILYLHIDSKDRISAGTEVSVGDRIGHPSCEGGFSSGTHLHIARRYNGVWITADGSIPFVLDGWTASGDGVEYNGFLIKNDQKVEAWDAFVPENQISR